MLIGLVAKKGSGKDTMGDYMVKNYNFEKTHFADPLKEAVRHIFDLNDEQLYGNDKETFDPRWNKTPRELFQIFGTDIMRNIMSPMLGLENNLWVHRFRVWYEDKRDSNIVVADVRFPSEADEIRELGGILIRIDGNSKNEDYHISEQLINEIPVDHIIENNGSIEEYHEKIKVLVEKLSITKMK